MDAVDLAVIETMNRYGGSFVRRLADAFRHADAENFAKLKAAFPEYWASYLAIAREPAPPQSTEPAQ